MRSKALCIFLGMTVLALFAASSGLAAEPIKVGAVLEVTGGLSFLGEPAKNTLMMIQKEVNDAGGINGHPLDLIIYDTEGKPTLAVTLVQKLIKKDNVCAIVGPLSSGSALAAIPTIEEAEIPNIALGASIKIVEPPKRWVFNTVQTDTNAVSRIYAFMKKKGYKKIGLATVSNGFGDSGREQLMKIAVPVANGRLCLHFGHCSQFVIHEVDLSSKRTLRRDYLTPPPHEPGVLPRWLHQQGANVIISGGMGARAQSLFAENGIQVIVGAASGAPEQVVQAYLDGTLQTGANICDH